VKKVSKILAFIIIFVCLFSFFQGIFHQRWNQGYENYVKYEKTEDVDIVLIGTSELWVGVIPMELYGEAGITAFNLGHSYQSSPTFYREVEYAVKVHHPKYVVLDFHSLFSNKTPQNYEEIYRSILYAIPDQEVRLELLSDIWKLDAKEALTFTFPLLRFHDMWSTQEANFSEEYLYDEIEPDYMMGWYTYNDITYEDGQSGEKRVITREMWEVDPDATDIQISDFDREYYDKIVDLCKEKGIQLIAIYPPKYSEAGVKSAQWETAKQYLEENDIWYLNYNTYESAMRLGLDWNDDFIDVSHLNYKGAMKWSKILAKDLAALGLTDHREDDTEFRRRLDTWYREYTEHYEALEKD